MVICFISPKYPSRLGESDYVFVKNIVDAIALKGYVCYVLSPFNVSHYRGLVAVKEFERRGRGSVTVIRPRYISLKNLHFGSFQISAWLQKKALKKAFRLMTIKPDIIYGHFWSSAYMGYEYAKKNNIPLFVASGESSIPSLFKIPSDITSFKHYLSGVICVSSKNRDESVTLGLTTKDKCGVFPNAIDASLFYKRAREECRNSLGIPQGVFIVAFVGWFNKRKGASRVAAAISRIHGKQVYSIFIGEGESGDENDPQCEGILYKGAVTHDMVPVYLNAADCFVLPTLHEGCCNAVIEAMACGLPVISSNLPFNWDVLDETNSIMIDPNSIEGIAEAICKLRDDPRLRAQLSEGALKKAKSLTLEHRAESILEFIKSKAYKK